MKSSWKKFLLYSSIVIVVGGVIFFLIPLGYSYSWTGFGEYIPTNPDAVRGKTFWDWMELLIVPLVLAGGAFLLNKSEKEIERNTAEARANLERELATDRQQEAALQNYIDRMSELLLKDNLRESKNPELWKVARTRTLTVLRILDPTRRALVLRFLYEVELLSIDKPRIDMSSADLSNINLSGLNLEFVCLDRVDMHNANLHKTWMVGASLYMSNINNADLSDVQLNHANLYGVDLQNANMQDAKIHNNDFTGANLERSNLNNTNLRNSILQSTNLSGATFLNAQLFDSDFSNANLKNAKISIEQLATAKSLKGATMPDGTIHD